MANKKAWIVAIVTVVGCAGGPAPESVDEFARAERADFGARTESSAEAGDEQDRDERASSVTRIRCHAQANRPHNSSHVPGTINATGEVTCSAPVLSIAMAIGLYARLSDGDTRLVSHGEARRSGVSAWANAATECAVGTYVATVGAHIVPPIGYEPVMSGTTARSSDVALACPTPRRRWGDDESGDTPGGGESTSEQRGDETLIAEFELRRE